MTATVTTAIKQWKTLKIGAGGWLTGFDQHTDGTLVTWSDVNGPWLWNGTTWDYLINTTSMPASERHLDNHSGVVSVVIAPSNSNIFYMFYYGNIYKSSNKGSTWTLCTGWTRLADGRSSSNAQTAQRYSGPLMAVDPANANVVYVATQDDGLFRTLDAGATFTVRTDVPVGTGTAADGHAGVNGVLFDPTSSTTTVSGVTTTAKVWAASRGDGYYTSTDGGTTWTRPTGGPTTCVNRAAFHTNGTLWCFNYTTGDELWRNVAGTWEEITASITGQGGHAIACDPNDADRIILSTGGGTLQESLNCNAVTPTFSTLWFGVASNSSPEIPWFEMAYTAGGSPYMSNGDMRFSKVSGETNKLLFADGIAFWTTTLAPSFSSVTWTAYSAGIENIIAQQATAATNGKLHLTTMDRPLWTISNPDEYPSTYHLKTTGSLDHGQSTEYCYQDPDVACCANGLKPGYTTDGGATWTQFTGNPAGWSNGWGQIVPLSATQFVWAPASAQRWYRTTDAGANWTAITITGINNDATADGWGAFGDGSHFYHRDVIAADGVTAGTIYAFSYNKGVFKSTDYGANWSNVYSGSLLGIGAYFQTGFKGVFGKAGHLWATPGKSTTNDALGYVNYDDAPTGAFKRSVDGGETWVTVNTNDVLEVYAFGFGKAATGATYPTVFIIGYVNGVFGIYYSTDATDSPSDPDVLTWTKIADGFPAGQLINPSSIEGDKLTFGKAYVGAGGSGFIYTPGTIYGRHNLQF